jgi:hypothetical protein
MNDDNLLSELTSGQTDITPFPDIYELNEQELFTPWGDNIEEPCPEDENTPIPCSFTGPLMYLAISHLEAVNEYKKCCETHVAKEMVAAIPEMVEYLLSEKCISVFVPQEWKGIHGIDPIDFEVLPDMPTSYKPKVRPINGQLFKDVKAEFNRMKTYFYEKSQSPIASPLVVAPKATAPFIRLCGNYIWPNKFIKRPHFPIPNVQYMAEVQVLHGPGYGELFPSVPVIRKSFRLIIYHHTLGYI